MLTAVRDTKTKPKYIIEGRETFKTSKLNLNVSRGHSEIRYHSHEDGRRLTSRKLAICVQNAGVSTKSKELSIPVATLYVCFPTDSYSSRIS